MSEGSLHYKDLEIWAERGPQNGEYVIASTGTTFSNNLQVMVGCGVSGYVYLSCCATLIASPSILSISSAPTRTRSSIANCIRTESKSVVSRVGAHGEIIEVSEAPFQCRHDSPDIPLPQRQFPNVAEFGGRIGVPDHGFEESQIRLLCFDVASS